MLTYTRLILTSVLLASVSPPAQAETVYVSNEKDNSVSVIDGNLLLAEGNLDHQDRAAVCAASS